MRGILSLIETEDGQGGAHEGGHPFEGDTEIFLDEMPKVGEMFFFDRGRSHTGTVRSVKHEANEILFFKTRRSTYKLEVQP